MHDDSQNPYQATHTELLTEAHAGSWGYLCLGWTSIASGWCFLFFFALLLLMFVVKLPKSDDLPGMIVGTFFMLFSGVFAIWFGRRLLRKAGSRPSADEQPFVSPTR
jgi:hypothetical protein